MDRDKDELQREIVRCLEEGSTEGLRRCLRELHPADIAEALSSVKLAQQIKVLRVMEPDRAAIVLIELDREMIPPLINGLGRQRTADILGKMFTDDAADLLGDLPGEEMEILLSLMKRSEAEDVQELLEYDPETAGGIMTTEYVAIRQDVTAEEAIRILREIAPDAETVYYVYVVNGQDQLVGVMSLRDLILAPALVPVEDIMRTKFITVNVGTDQEEVARVVAKYDFLAIPVVDDQGHLLGIVTVDDVLDVIEEEATEDIMRVAANLDSEGQDMDASPMRRAARRLPWLIGLLFGSLLTGKVIEQFEITVATIPVLVYFMTALAGGTGNAATQSLTVVVRGIATGEINPGKVFPIIWKEARVGVYVGLVSGLVLAGAAFFFSHGNPLIGMVVGISLAVSIMFSTVAGSLVPVVIHRFGIDPALASGPFIATMMDITSMSIYFTLATMLLM